MNELGLWRAWARVWHIWNQVTMLSQYSLGSVVNALIVSLKRATCVSYSGSTLTGVLCWVMEKQGSPKMANPFTTSLEPPLSVNTLFSMKDVLPRSTLLPLLTKLLLSVVDSAQVCFILFRILVFTKCYKQSWLLFWLKIIMQWSCKEFLDYHPIINHLYHHCMQTYIMYGKFFVFYNNKKILRS